MFQNNRNLLNERKISNISNTSTSLNAPFNKPINSFRTNDISSNITKKEYPYKIQNSLNIKDKSDKLDLNLNNELNRLNQIYYNKKIELNNAINEYKINNDIYIKKNNKLEKDKERYESLKQKNLNLKLMIMNIMNNKK